MSNVKADFPKLIYGHWADVLNIPYESVNWFQMVKNYWYLQILILTISCISKHWIYDMAYVPFIQDTWKITSTVTVLTKKVRKKITDPKKQWRKNIAQ